MRIYYLLIGLIGMYAHGFAQPRGAAPAPNEVQRPRLVVGIVVDQMRWDFLYRYYDRYTAKGFKRLLGEGFSCEHTGIPYVPTFTACGHAAIYTGSVPAINGIAGNEWYLQEGGKKVYCTEDALCQTVGSHSAAGQMSPVNLLTSTIGDELRLATNFRSKVIGIALKDRGAILAAGHSANGAYWFDDATGSWITSSYYRNELPLWVQQFNEKRLAEKFLAGNWNTLYPISSYKQSTRDDNPYEGPFAGEATSAFPHPLTLDGKRDFSRLRTTPFANTLTIEFAQAAIKQEALGNDGFTDLLAVSFSATDYIGHQFGPNSIEMEDTYIRLDRELASFFDFLDREVGKDQYTVFLSADHGAAHNHTFLQEHKIPAGSWDAHALKNNLNQHLEKQYGVAGLVLSIYNYQVVWDNQKTASVDKAALRMDCVEFLSRQPGIAWAVDVTRIGNSTLPAALRESVVNGYQAQRSGEIFIMLKPAWYQTPGRTGTVHGSWNPYDARVPLLFMGWGINKGRIFDPVSIIDIAPTIAALLHIQVPNGSIGKVIPKVLDRD